MFIGSLLGDAGTLIGAAVGSITYSAGAFVVEDRARRAHAKLKARLDTSKAVAEPEKHHIQAQLAAQPLGRMALDHARAEQHLRQTWNPRRKAAVAAGTLFLCLASAAVALVTIEAATGKTLSSFSGGPVQYGTTLGGYSTRKPSPAVVVVPSSSPASETPSAGSPAPSGVLPDPSPDAAPDASPDTTPSVTISPQVSSAGSPQ
jgi:hypothetical protein